MTRPSDRILGLVVILMALAYIAGAMQIQASFLSDPVGSKTFPIIVASIAVLCGGIMVFAPDAEPAWPGLRTVGSLFISVLLLVGYSYALKPLGFIIPTCVAAGVLSYQINPRAGAAALTGAGLSVGLFVLFKFVLGLGLNGFPKGWMF
jgi:putative tricarboxylic transport membrane protein